MRGSSGIRALLVIVLLFTMLSVVNGFELFNSNEETVIIEMENKINVQVGSDSYLSVGEVSAIEIVGLKQQGTGLYSTTIIAYIGFEMGQDYYIDTLKELTRSLTGFT